MREAEGLALDLAVTAVDEDLVLVLERLLQLGNVDVLIVLYAGERDGFIARFREQLEAARLRPVAGLLRHLEVARITVLDAFLLELLEFEFQPVDVRDAGRRRRHVLVVVRLELEEIEVVAAARDRL